MLGSFHFVLACMWHFARGCISLRVLKMVFEQTTQISIVFEAGWSMYNPHSWISATKLKPHVETLESTR